MLGKRWAAFPRPALPLHAAFFGSINLRRLRGFVEEKPLDVIEQKVLCIRVREIEPVVIDDLRLLLQPRSPAGLANLSRNTLAQFVW